MWHVLSEEEMSSAGSMSNGNVKVRDHAQFLSIRNGGIMLTVLSKISLEAILVFRQGILFVFLDNQGCRIDPTRT
jgi:hypothetical protein